MGRPKLLLPLGDWPVVAHLLQALRSTQVERTVVVVRGDDPELHECVRQWGGTAVVPPAEPTDMRGSIQCAVRWIAESYQPSPADGLLVVPGDFPGTRAEIVDRLIAAWRASGSRIAVPVFEGRRGHPVLLAWTLAEEILALPEGVGLNVLVRRHESDTVECAVETSAILQDLDVPSDYEKLQHRLGSQSS